jgi:hypothetical protein
MPLLRKSKRDQLDTRKEILSDIQGECPPSSFTSNYPPKQRKKSLPKTVYPQWIDVPFPPFLPYERPNELEYPLQSEAKVKRSWRILPKPQSSKDQTGSKLMSIPSELRGIIFDHLIGRNNVHLWFNYAPQKWRGGRCLNLDAPNTEDYQPKRLESNSRITYYKFGWNWYHTVCKEKERSAGRADKWHACLDNRYKYPHGNCRYTVEHVNVEPFCTEKINVMPYLLVCRKL